MYKSEMNFSIIVPLYNEGENITNLNDEILKVIKILLAENKFNFEILYVDDGSSDNTFEILKSLKNIVPTTIVKNNKNLSQSVSILNGIEASVFENIILLDGDLQNDPKDFVPMINKYTSNENSVVHGNRKFRKDPYWSKILPSKIANYIVRKFTNSSISDHGCSLKIFKKKIIETENLFGDFHRLFAAQINQKKINIIEVGVNHRNRRMGTSNYGFERVFRVLIDLIFLSFTKNERSYFYTIGSLGLFSFFLSLISFIYMVYLKFFLDKSFIDTPMPGIVIFFALAGLIFFSIVLMLETIKKMLRNDKSPNKTYEIFKLN